MMKRIFFVIITIFSFIMMILYPNYVFYGAKRGLLLWFQTVLPSLLPFFIVVNILIKTNAIQYISHFLYPVLGPVFSVSEESCFAILTGFLCGYPMGAKVTADLVKARRISKPEGAYLLSFCNNTSPGFLSGFVVTQTLKQPELLLPSICIVLFTPVLFSFLFRIHYRFRNHTSGCSLICNRFSIRSDILDQSIMDGFEAITKIGGYIILFSILLSLAILFPLHHPIWEEGILPFLEITNGVVLISDSYFSPAVRYSLTMGLCVFGGLCAAAQTNCMISGSGIPFVPYIIEKLAAAIAASLFSYLFFCNFYM